MAGDPGAAILLLAMGYDSFSMNVTNLAKVKSIIRSITSADAQALLDTVIQMNKAQEVRETVYNVLEEKGVTRVYRDPIKSWRRK